MSNSSSAASAAPSAFMTGLRRLALRLSTLIPKQATNSANASNEVPKMLKNMMESAKTLTEMETKLPALQTQLTTLKNKRSELEKALDALAAKKTGAEQKFASLKESLEKEKKNEEEKSRQAQQQEENAVRAANATATQQINDAETKKTAEEARAAKIVSDAQAAAQQVINEATSAFNAIKAQTEDAKKRAVAEKEIREKEAANTLAQTIAKLQEDVKSAEDNVKDAMQQFTDIGEKARAVYQEIDGLEDKLGIADASITAAKEAKMKLNGAIEAAAKRANAEAEILSAQTAKGSEEKLGNINWSTISPNEIKSYNASLKPIQNEVNSKFSAEKVEKLKSVPLASNYNATKESLDKGIQDAQSVNNIATKLESASAAANEAIKAATQAIGAANATVVAASAAAASATSPTQGGRRSLRTLRNKRVLRKRTRKHR